VIDSVQGIGQDQYIAEQRKEYERCGLTFSCSMPVLVRSILVFQSVMDLRFFVLVSWSGEGPTLTLWFSPPVGTEGATRFSLTTHTLGSAVRSLLRQPFCGLHNIVR
jgi:hypothetical protein